jgi:ABC-type enterochelin transport system permease subunit
MISKAEKEKFKMFFYKIRTTMELLENIKPNEFSILSERLLTLVQDFEKEIFVEKCKTVLVDSTIIRNT